VQELLLADVEAFCRAQAGGFVPTPEQQNSWERFFESYLTATRQIARKMGLKGGDVDDCLQDAWTEVFLQLATGRFNPQRGRLYCWIYSLVRNKAVDRLRSARPGVASGQDQLDHFPSSREIDPAVAYEKKRKYRRLHAALDTLLGRLSPTTYQTLYRYWIEEQDCAETARELGLTVEQVRYRRSRAKQILRQLLTQAAEADGSSRGG
jgi:RNA polymerase sigma factor (sigma-70 family)